MPAILTDPATGDTLTVSVSGDNWVGTLVDKRGSPIVGATIEFESSKREQGKGTTDKTGSFDIDSSNWIYNLAIGDACQVRISYPGGGWTDAFVQST